MSELAQQILALIERMERETARMSEYQIIDYHSALIDDIKALCLWRVIGVTGEQPTSSIMWHGNVPAGTSITIQARAPMDAKWTDRQS